MPRKEQKNAPGWVHFRENGCKNYHLLISQLFAIDKSASLFSAIIITSYLKYSANLKERQ